MRDNHLDNLLHVYSTVFIKSFNIFAALTDLFAGPFVHHNVSRVFDVVVRNDVRKFDADAILYGDTWGKKMDISMF